MGGQDGVGHDRLKPFIKRGSGQRELKRLENYVNGLVENF